jgi:hypothetical protein
MRGRGRGRRQWVAGGRGWKKGEDEGEEAMAMGGGGKGWKKGEDEGEEAMDVRGKGWVAIRLIYNASPYAENSRNTKVTATATWGIPVPALRQN